MRPFCFWALFIGFPAPMSAWGAISEERSEDIMGYRVAVVGATGNVGREMLQILSERQFPVSEVVALASERSVGSEISFGEDDVLNIRNGPSEYHDAVGAIPPSARGVKIVGACSELWCPVVHGRAKGWVNSYYLSPEAGSTARTTAAHTPR